MAECRTGSDLCSGQTTVIARHVTSISLLVESLADSRVVCCCLCCCRYKELAEQHQKILQHLHHKIEQMSGAVNH